MVNVQSRHVGQALWFVSPPFTVQAAQTIAATIRDRKQADEIQIRPSLTGRLVDVRV